MAREKAALQSGYEDTRARDLQEGSGGSSKYWPPALALGAPAGQGGLGQSRPKRPLGSSQWAPARKAHTPGLRCPQQVTRFCHCWGRSGSWGRPSGPPLESSRNPPKATTWLTATKTHLRSWGPWGSVCSQVTHWPPWPSRVVTTLRVCRLQMCTSPRRDLFRDAPVRLGHGGERAGHHAAGGSGAPASSSQLRGQL